MVNRICVYCGSRMGSKPRYEEGARALGESLVKHGIGLVYGGSRVGLMNILASTVMLHGGEVIGILPANLLHVEPEHNSITELHYVETMHERKALMETYADGFIAMPGGIGTYDELFEIITWHHLGIHNKPIGALSIDGYFDPMFALLRHGVDEGFILPAVLDNLIVDDIPASLVEMMIHYK